MINVRNHTLHVTNLHPYVDEDILNDMFSTVGEVRKIHLCRNPTNYVSLGYAYVTFYSHEDAQEALDTLNFTYLMNRPMRISWRNSNSTLRKLGVGNIFIKNLHEDITDGMLYDTFMRFGEILSCKVALYDNNRSKGYGFVQYATEEAATKAIEKVNGMSLMGKIVYVGPFRKKNERPRELGDQEPCFNNVYVKNFGEETGEEELRAIFGKMGELLRVQIMTDQSGKSRGFGFVTYKDLDSAKDAISELNGMEVIPDSGKQLCVSRAIKHGERKEQLKLKREESLNRRQGSKIYVGYLEKFVDDECLHEMFQEFGTIVSAMVRLQDGVSRGFGFVNFSSPQEAETAITEMDGSPCGKNKLRVSLAKTKEEYQAFLNYQRLKSLENPHFDLNLHSLETDSIPFTGLEQPELSSLKHETVNLEENSTSLNSTSCNRSDVTGNVAPSDLEQPRPLSLGQETDVTTNANGLKQTRRQRKKKNDARAEPKGSPITEGSIPQNDILLKQLGGQLNQKDHKSDLKKASRKQKVLERTAVKTTKKEKLLFGKKKLQYSAKIFDGQRERRHVRKPLTLGSFITLLQKQTLNTFY